MVSSGIFLIGKTNLMHAKCYCFIGVYASAVFTVFTLLLNVNADKEFIKAIGRNICFDCVFTANGVYMYRLRKLRQLLFDRGIHVARTSKCMTYTL